MSPSDLFTPDFRPTPYWWERTPRPELASAPPPARADVVVVGSGYTGLHAALQLARHGRSVVVLDAETAGYGCSTRNGGQVSTGVKPSLAALSRAYGEAQARAIVDEGHRSLAWLGDFIAEEGIDCGFRVSGRFHGAHSRRQFRRLCREVAAAPHHSQDDVRIVPAGEQAREIGSSAYQGGVVYLRHAALDPARYHRGLLERVIAAGAAITPHCPVTGIERGASGFRVTTDLGTVQAGDVIVATNGYTGAATPWLRRRIIPIGSYIIATEPLPTGLIDQLLPSDRMVTDTRRVVYYYRASPDRTRILFGGRVSWNETDPKVSAPHLHVEMRRIFPQLAGIKVSHSWMGFVAFTFDTLMHSGVHAGAYYATGYCGSGVGMASYLGMKMGLRVLGHGGASTVFDALRFPSRPYYNGYPWFLGPAIACYRLVDRFS